MSTQECRVLVVCYRFPRSVNEPIVSGEIKHPWNLVRWLRDSGCTVEVLSVEEVDEAYTHEELAVRVRTVAAGAGRGILRHLRRAYLIYFGIKAILRRMPFEVVHTHVAYGALAAALAAPRSTRVVSTAHGTNIPEIATELRRVPKRRGIRWLNAWLQATVDSLGWRSASTVISVSQYQVGELKRIYRVPSGRVRVVSTGVDERYVFDAVSRERVRRSLGIPLTARVVLMVGRLAHKKRFAWAAESLADLITNEPSLHLLLVTGTEEFVTDRVALQRVLSGLPASQVHVSHSVPEAQIPGYYSAADVVIVPSEGYESLPNVVLEALMSGVQVVATEAWGHVEVLPQSSLFAEESRTAFRQCVSAALSQAVDKADRSPTLPSRFLRENVVQNLREIYAGDE